jgi:hypothetical protein
LHPQPLCLPSHPPNRSAHFRNSQPYKNFPYSPLPITGVKRRRRSSTAQSSNHPNYFSSVNHSTIQEHTHPAPSRVTSPQTPRLLYG